MSSNIYYDYVLKEKMNSLSQVWYVPVLGEKQ